jgi:hypothetical protein
MDTLQDENWPRQLRVGSGVYAWALLDDVPVIYEIWRQLNGFPPALNNMPDMVPDKKNKEKSEKQEDEDSKAS